MKNENLHLVKIFRDDVGQSYIETILIRAELAQYKRQLSLGKKYSWKDFVAELAKNKPLWNETLMAFRDALLHLDFKPAAQYALK